MASNPSNSSNLEHLALKGFKGGGGVRKVKIRKNATTDVNQKDKSVFGFLLNVYL